MQELKFVHGRVICSVNLEGKNSHRFANGTVIRLERNYDNFNKRQTQPVNAIVIDAEHIPAGAEVLISHNSTHDTNRIFDYKPLSGDDIASDVKYFSLPESECFLWRMGSDEWKPLPPFATALRVFKPYTGILSGIDHHKLKDILFVTSGKLQGKVVKTLRGCDYVCIFQDDGREKNIIRFRPFGDKENKREQEAIATLNDETEMVRKGELLIGLSSSTAKKLNYDSKAIKEAHKAS